MSDSGKIRAAKWEVLRQRREIPHDIRRLYHLIMGLVSFAIYAWWLDRSSALWTLAAVGVPLLAFDIVRLRSARVRNLALKHLAPLMRRNELLNLSGNSYFILGLFVILGCFSKNIALLSVLFLAIGDPVASFFGTRYGSWRLPGGKSVQGCLANAVVSALAAGAFGVGYLDLAWADAVVLAVVGGTVSMVAEWVPSPVDDNLTIPVLSALQLHALQSLFIVKI